MEITSNKTNPIALEGHTPTKAFSAEVDANIGAEKVATTVAPAEKISTVATEEAKAMTKVDEVSQRESLQNAVAKINEHMQSLERTLQFTVDEESGKDVVTVSDKKTEEIIRQFPTEEVLVIARQIAENRDSTVSLMSIEV